MFGGRRVLLFIYIWFQPIPYTYYAVLPNTHTNVCMCVCVLTVRANVQLLLLGARRTWRSPGEKEN